MPKIPQFRTFSFLLLAFFAGLLIYQIYPLPFEQNSIVLLWLCLSLLFSLLFNVLYKNLLQSFICSLLLALVAGFFYFSYFDFKSTPRIETGTDYQIKGHIAAKPVISERNQSMIFRVKSLNSQSLEKPFLVSLNIPKYPPYSYGQGLTLEGKFSFPENSNDFREKNYLLAKNIKLKFDQTQISTHNRQFSPKESIYSSLYFVSDKFENSLNRALPEPDAALASGLILGIKRNIPDQLKENLASTGTSHIIALSGFNVTIIFTIIFGLLIGRIPRKSVFLLSALLIFGFVILTGAASSVVRAAIFSAGILIGRLLGRRADHTNIMLFAAFLMILTNPFILVFDIGFQLSFAAFAGIIYLSPLLATLLNQKIPQWLSQTLTETLSAQAFAAPIILYYFAQFSLISPLANALVLPFIPLSMLFSFATGLLGIIYSPLSNIAIVFLWPIFRYIIGVINSLGNLPFAQIKNPLISWALLLLFYILLLRAIMRKNKYRKRLV